MTEEPRESGRVRITSPLSSAPAHVRSTVGQEIVRGMRARRALHGEPAGRAFVALFRRNGRRYGGYVVHLGVAVIAVAIAAS